MAFLLSLLQPFSFRPHSDMVSEHLPDPSTCAKPIASSAIGLAQILAPSDNPVLPSATPEQRSFLGLPCSTQFEAFLSHACALSSQQVADRHSIDPPPLSANVVATMPMQTCFVLADSVSSGMPMIDADSWSHCEAINDTPMQHFLLRNDLACTQAHASIAGQLHGLCNGKSYPAFNATGFPVKATSYMPKVFLNMPHGAISFLQATSSWAIQAEQIKAASTPQSIHIICDMHGLMFWLSVLSKSTLTAYFWHATSSLLP